jgi:hypothetical protein
MGDFLLTYGNLGHGRSNALQIEVDRRFAGGFLFNASYTLLDQKSAVPDTGNSSLGGTTYNQFMPQNDFGTDGFVSRHRFIAYGVWDVPFGKGRRFGSSLPTAVELIAGGWQLQYVCQEWLWILALLVLQQLRPGDTGATFSALD